jgi:predicted PurR-regulated permease PerM
MPPDARDQPELRSIAVTLRTAVIFAAAVFVAFMLGRVLLLAFAAILVAIALAAGARGLGRLGLPRGPGVLATAAIAALLLYLITRFLAPSIADQAAELWEQLPETGARIGAALGLDGWLQAAFGRLWARLGARLAELDAGAASRAAGGLFAAASTTFGAVVETLIVLLMAIHLAMDPEPYRRGALALLPARAGPALRATLDASAVVLRRWLLGALVAMTFIGLTSFTGLLLLGIPLALALALIAALLAFVPNVGPVLALVPALVVALGQSPTAALWVLALYLSIQTVESYLLTPMVQERAVFLPPALTLLAQLVMGLAYGALGLLLATPLAAVALVIARRHLVDGVVEAKLSSPEVGEPERRAPRPRAAAGR